MKAWHFVSDTLRDGTPIPADGETLKFDGEPIMRQQGLHASVHPFDALQYAPGDTLCYVELGGRIIESDDKVVATERTIVARMDAAEMLRYFARGQALSVVHLWDAPDSVLDYLMTGKARDAARYAALDASAEAWDAARYASAEAWDVARYAAWCATWDAAWCAARDAAWCAARDVARYAARDVASAAWCAARDVASADFNALVFECFEGVLETAERSK